jgi:hypothetical protein
MALNNMVGSLPEDWTALSTNLELLGFQGANIRVGRDKPSLSGTIPSGIADLKALTALELSGNKFTGVVPALPFAQYTLWCCLQHLTRDGYSPTNAYACPLPPHSRLCKRGPPTCPVATTTAVPTTTVGPTATTAAPTTTTSPLSSTSSPTTTAAPTTTAPPAPSITPAPATSAPPVVAISLGGLVVVAAAAAAWFFYRHRREPRKLGRGLGGDDWSEPLLENGAGFDAVQQPAPGTKVELQDSGEYAGSTGGGGFSAPGPMTPALPALPAEYDDMTGAPTNTTAKRAVAREWRTAVAAGALPHVIQLPFDMLNRVTNHFDESNWVGGGASCAVFRCTLFGVPVAVKLLKAAAVEWEAKQFESER